MTNEKKTTTKDRSAVFIKAAFEALKEAGGSLPLRDVKAAVAKRVPLTEADLAVYAKTGYVHWESVLHFYSISCVKAGFLRKSSGLWHLTADGEKVVDLPASELMDRAVRAYRQWKAAQTDGTPAAVTPSLPAVSEALVENPTSSFVLERAEGEARAEIEDRVRALGPYEYQELVAALLRGMGYATPFVAPAGPGGGTDILAYPDPIGAKTPHIRVQVKHRATQKATRDEIAALRGIIRADREIGLFVSTAGFTSEAVREARQGAVHIELMDLNGLLEQWIAAYERLSEEDKGLLRLRRVYFLAPE
jgi:restriction system protein